jgi:hypothetical protein
MWESGPQFLSVPLQNDALNQMFQRMVPRTGLIVKEPAILMNGSPKPDNQYLLDKWNCPCNSKTGHSKEPF